MIRDTGFRWSVTVYFMPNPSQSPTNARIVVIGDLNGAADALVQILRGTGLLK